MEKLQKMIIADVDGSESEVEIVTSFYDKGQSKQYLVYTKRETQGDNNIIYVSIVVDEGKTIYLEDIESDEEWIEVKGLIKEILSR